MGKKKYKKQIQSFKRVIDEHLEKIRFEQLKNNPDIKLIFYWVFYWEKEIEKFKNEIIKAEKRLQRG